MIPTTDKAATKKPRESAEDKDEATTETLCDLALAVTRNQVRRTASDLAEQQSIDFSKIIKRSLHQKKDEILYDALARTETNDPQAALTLKLAIEDAAEVTVIERADGKTLEINAFVIPLFLHTIGGLDPERCFQDQEAFTALTASFQAEYLESPDASVVLVSHGYHLNEIDGITFSHLHDMLRDAFAAMSDKRIAATPAIDRSFGGWPDSPFAPHDKAIELRFLLGFALKSVDDPFYEVPEDEDRADAYFAKREQRFQHWTGKVAPLVLRCFGLQNGGPASGSGTTAQVQPDSDVHFLYQDMFHGGKERGIAEYFMLQMISDLNHGLQLKNVAAGATRAVIGPVDLSDDSVLRVQLLSIADGTLVVSADKPLPGQIDWALEVADAASALTMIGVQTASVAAGFDATGAPRDVRTYPMQAASQAA